MNQTLISRLSIALSFLAHLGQTTCYMQAQPQSDFIYNLKEGNIEQMTHDVVAFTGCSPYEPESKDVTLWRKGPADNDFIKVVDRYASYDGYEHNFQWSCISYPSCFELSGIVINSDNPNLQGKQDYELRSPTCQDTDNGAANTLNFPCSYYDEPNKCYQPLDDLDFTAGDMCCFCGGGQINPNGNVAAFQGNFCFWQDFPSSIWDDEAQQLTITIQTQMGSEPQFKFSSYNLPGPAIQCFPLTFDLTFDTAEEPWMEFILHNDHYDFNVDLTGSPTFNSQMFYDFTFKVMAGTPPQEVVSQQFKITIVDCTQNDIILANLPTADSLNNSLFLNANTYYDTGESAYYWMKGGDEFRFTLNTPTANQAFPVECGQGQYLINDNAANPNTIELLGSAPEQELEIETDINDDAEFSITFSFQNDYFTEIDYTTVTIKIAGCDTTGFEEYSGTAIEFTFQLNTSTEMSFQWNEFKFLKSFCAVDKYEMTCNGPYLDVTGDMLDPNNIMPAHVEDPCTDTVDVDLDPDVRSFTEQFETNNLQNFHEGEYFIKITGYNTVYATNKMEVFFIWKLLADCSTAETTITGPTTVWSNPLITSLLADGTVEENDFSRKYQVAPPEGTDMQIFYQVGTPYVEYSLTDFNYNCYEWNGEVWTGETCSSSPESTTCGCPVCDACDPNIDNFTLQKSFSTNYFYSCQLEYSFIYRKDETEQWAAFPQGQFIQLHIVDDSNVSIVFDHDDGSMGTGNRNYFNYNEYTFSIVAGFMSIDPTKRETIEFVLQIFPDCTSTGQPCSSTNYGNIDSQSNSCVDYEDNIADCSIYDTELFVANVMCCACGGGQSFAIWNEWQQQALIEEFLPLPIDPAIFRQPQIIYFNNIYNDGDVCGTDLQYSLKQVYYGGPGDFNPDLFFFDATTLTISLQDSNQLQLDKHSTVIQYDRNGAVICDLSDNSQTATPNCKIQYEIVVSNTIMNGTLTTAGYGEVIFKSECDNLGPMYVTMSAEWWQWPDNAAFALGYHVRDPIVFVKMPMLFPELDSVEDFQPFCGDIEYTFYNHTYDLPEGALPLVLSHIDAPPDNSDAVEIEIYTDNFLMADEFQSNHYTKFYIFEVRVSLVLWESFGIKSSNDTQGFDLNFYVRDFCLGATYTSPKMVQIPQFVQNETDVYVNIDASNQHGELYLRKHVLQPGTLFHLQYHKYIPYDNAINTDTGTDCGWVQYNLEMEQAPVYNIDVFNNNLPLYEGELVLISPSNSSIFDDDAGGLRIGVQVNSYDWVDASPYYYQYELSLSVYEAEVSTWLPLEVNHVRIDILPCLVNSFVSQTESPNSFSLLVNKDLFFFEWDEFVQDPECDYTIEYTLTIEEIDGTEVPDFDSLTEGQVPEPSLVTFNPEDREMEFQVFSSEHLDKTYVCYLNANLGVSSWQSPVSSQLLPWQIEVITTYFEVPNGKPYIDGLALVYEVEAEKKTLINLGIPIDPEGLQVMILSWKIEQGIYPWIVLKQTIFDSTIDSVDFEFTPPQEMIGESFTLDLILSDQNDDPQEAQISADFNIIPFKESSYNVTLNENNTNDDTIYEAIANEPSLYGVMVIDFMFDVILPEGVHNWTSENVGGQYFELKYVPSSETETLFEEADIYVEMGWSVISTDINSITLQLNFTNYLAVSTSPYEVDQLTFNIKKPEEFIVVGENRPLMWKQVPVSNNLVQQIGDPDSKAFLDAVTSAIETTLTVFISSNFLASIALSGVLQFLWGLVNALQMIVLTVLFSLMRPMNAELVLTTIMSYVNLDMFETESILNYFFDFVESEPFTPIFKKAGYQSTTYIIELGVVFFVVVGFVCCAIVREILKVYFKKSTANNKVTYYIKTQIQQFRYKVVIVRFLLEGCIELGVTAMICVLSLGGSKLDVTGERMLEESDLQEEPNTSNRISDVCAILTLIGLFCSTFYLYHCAKKFYKGYEDPEIKRKYIKMFDSLQVKSFSQLNYSLIFILRRCTMVLVLTLLPTQRNLQISFQLVSTLFVMSYTAYVLPFQSLLLNYQEVFNEITVLLASYHLFCFTEWVYDLNARFLIGWSLLAVIAINVVTNIGIMLFVVGKQSIEKCTIAYYKRETKRIIKQREQNARNRQIQQQNNFPFLIEARTQNFLFHQPSTLQRRKPIAPVNNVMNEVSSRSSEQSAEEVSVIDAVEESPPIEDLNSQINDRPKHSIGGGFFPLRMNNNKEGKNSHQSGDLGLIPNPHAKIKNEEPQELSLFAKKEHRLNGDGTLVISINNMDNQVVESYNAPVREEEIKQPKVYQSIQERSPRLSQYEQQNMQHMYSRANLLQLSSANPGGAGYVKQNSLQKYRKHRPGEKTKNALIHSAQFTEPIRMDAPDFGTSSEHRHVNQFILPSQPSFKKNTNDQNDSVAQRSDDALNRYFNFHQQNLTLQSSFQNTLDNGQSMKHYRPKKTEEIGTEFQMRLEEQPSINSFRTSQRQAFANEFDNQEVEEITSMVNNAFENAFQSKNK